MRKLLGAVISMTLLFMQGTTGSGGQQLKKVPNTMPPDKVAPKVEKPLNLRRDSLDKKIDSLDKSAESTISVLNKGAKVLDKKLSALEKTAFKSTVETALKSDSVATPIAIHDTIFITKFIESPCDCEDSIKVKPVWWKRLFRKAE